LILSHMVRWRWAESRSLPIKHEWTRRTVVHRNHEVQKGAVHTLQIADGCVAMASPILSSALSLHSAAARCSSAVDTTTYYNTATAAALNDSSSSDIIHHSSWPCSSANAKMGQLTDWQWLKHLRYKPRPFTPFLIIIVYYYARRQQKI